MREVLARTFKVLSDSGVDVVLIGSNVVDIIGDLDFKEDDIDYFSVNVSPMVEEELFRGIAEREGWDFTYTDLGTPRYIVPTREGDVYVDIYENISDFYIPSEILEMETLTSKVENVNVKHISLEAYVVLKAHAAREEDDRDLKEISHLIDSKRLKLDKSKVRRLIEYYPEDERSSIISRLTRFRLM